MQKLVKMEIRGEKQRLMDEIEELITKNDLFKFHENLKM